MAQYISTVVLPGDSETYYLKDSEGRDLIAKKQDIINATNKLSGAFVTGIPSKTSELTNDSGFITLSDVPDAVSIDTALSSTSTNPVQNKVINTALSAKAALASPTFTGTPKAPTAAAGTNTTQIATTAFVQAAITALGSIMHFQGSKASESAIKAITSAKIGDVWLNSSDGSEWVCTETITAAKASAWEKFGVVVDLTGYAEKSELGALAYKDSASGSYTPAGTVSQPTFTGSSSTFGGDYVPEGSVTVSTNATTNKTATVSAAASGTVTYTPAGTVSQPTFTGVSSSFTGKCLPEGTVSITPTVTLNTTTVNSITAVGTLPSWGATVTDEVLSFNWSQGTLPTKGANTSVATTVKSATATGTFNGAASDVTVLGTPEGTVSQPTFTGTGARLVTGNIAVPNTYTATFTGTKAELSVSGTPNGTVSKPTFTGTQGSVSVS